jgi:hypothetical protein
MSGSPISSIELRSMLLLSALGRSDAGESEEVDHLEVVALLPEPIQQRRLALARNQVKRFFVNTCRRCDSRQ